MTLPAKFRKDLSTLRAATNTEIYLDIKNPNKTEEGQEYSSAELFEKLNTSFEKSHQLLNQLKQFLK